MRKEVRTERADVSVTEPTGDAVEVISMATATPTNVALCKSTIGKYR